MLPVIQTQLEQRYTVHQPNDTDITQAHERIRAVITGGGTGLPEPWFEKLPNLGLVAINGVGTDQVDLERARARNIRVSTTPDVLTEDVADMAIALLLAVCRHVVRGDALVRDGRWANGGTLPLGRSLRGQRIGILGLGQIGRAVARRSSAFGMAVAYYNRSDVDTPTDWIRCATPQQLARHCDALVVCIAATPATADLVDKTIFDALGQNGVLINIARGSVVDEQALIDALSTQRIAGAGLDVFKNEPAVRPAFSALDNVVVMPHQGSATVETRQAMGATVLANLEAFFASRQPPTSVL